MKKAALLLVVLLVAIPSALGGDGFLHLSHHELPLSTSSRWIVDAGGSRVKLACANWAAHLETVTAEGLGKQPLDVISRNVAELGFNCVRLTWPLYLLTRPTVGNLTVRASLSALGLLESIAGFQVNNPELLDLTLLQAFQDVVSNLASNNIMVILDNQISKPGWCCSKLDGNGFFGDEYFDPDEWLEGLRKMAKLFYGLNSVVGMSLRNELRGPNQTLDKWYKYMQEGAEAIHGENPNVLVIVSGLDYDKDLSYLLGNKHFELTFSKKLVYELHWYGFSDGEDWANENPNVACAGSSKNFTKKGGFLLEQGWPLFLSEFGGDLRGINVADNRFLSCFFGVAAEFDFDWAIWALQGSYYIRDGLLSYDETYGVLSWDWCKARNPDFIKRLNALQSPFQGPGLSSIPPYNILFHPLTGKCMVSSPDGITLGPCTDSNAWDYTRENRITLGDFGLCLQAAGAGLPTKLSANCLGSDSKWELVSESRMHIATRLDEGGGAEVCLDANSDGGVITNLCNYQGGSEASPESQWFKIIVSNKVTNLPIPWKR